MIDISCRPGWIKTIGQSPGMLLVYLIVQQANVMVIYIIDNYKLMQYVNGN